MPSVKQRVGRAVAREANQFAYNLQLLTSLGRPVVFQVELTNHCPMTCEMCPRTHAMTRPHGHMERDLFERIVDQAAGSTGMVFLHHFGDSLLHPDIGPMIGHARANGIGTYLSANPVLLTQPRIEALVDNGLDELVLSLDGLTSETSERIRGRAAANVELAERRIRALIDYRRAGGGDKPYIILQIVRQQHNVAEIERWLQKWEAVAGIDRLKVKSFIGWDGSHDAINELRPEPTRQPRAGVVCDKPWTSVTILWDGTVVPCCFDYDGLLALGNVGEESLTQIWRGEQLKALRRRHRDGDLRGLTLCERCTDYEGYPVRKWYYPLNRLRQTSAPLGDEWAPEDAPREPGCGTSGGACGCSG